MKSFRKYIATHDLGSPEPDTQLLLQTTDDAASSESACVVEAALQTPVSPESQAVLQGSGGTLIKDSVADTAKDPKQTEGLPVCLERRRSSSAEDVRVFCLQKRAAVSDAVDSCIRRCTSFVEASELRCRQRCAASGDEIEICLVEEEKFEAERKRKRPLKKRVRKRAWRLLRTSWKYFKRGMRSYAPGLSAMFTWGINFQQASTTTFGMGRPSRYA